MLFNYPRKVKKTLKSAKTLSGDVYSFVVRDARSFIEQLYYQTGMPRERIRLVDEEKQLRSYNDVLSPDVLYSIIVLDQVTFDGVSPCQNIYCREIHDAYTPFFRKDGVWVHDPYDSYDEYEYGYYPRGDSVLTIEESWIAMEQALEQYMAKNNIPVLTQTVFEVDEDEYSITIAENCEEYVKYYLRKEEVGWSRHICMIGHHGCSPLCSDVTFRQPRGSNICICHHDD